MGAHAEFIYRLVGLVEYAESNNLKVASLALNAAVEVIAPSIAQSISVTATEDFGAPYATYIPRPALRVIQGGRDDTINKWASQSAQPVRI